MAKIDSLAHKFHFKPSNCKRFGDDIFALREHGTASLSSFLDYLNTMDKTGKIKFTMEIAAQNFLIENSKSVKAREELMSMLNQSRPLAIPHLTPAIQKATFATYPEVQPFD